MDPEYEELLKREGDKLTEREKLVVEIDGRMRGLFKSPMDALGEVWTLFETPFDAIAFVIRNASVEQLQELKAKLEKKGRH